MIKDRLIKTRRTMSKQNFIADSIFAFLLSCLLFIISKSAVDCRTFKTLRYSNQNRVVIGGDSIQNGSLRAVLPIVIHLQRVFSMLQSPGSAKITNSKTGFCHFVKMWNFVEFTRRWNFKDIFSHHSSQDMDHHWFTQIRITLDNSRTTPYIMVHMVYDRFFGGWK